MFDDFARCVWNSVSRSFLFFIFLVKIQLLNIYLYMEMVSVGLVFSFLLYLHKLGRKPVRFLIFFIKEKVVQVLKCLNLFYRFVSKGYYL